MANVDHAILTGTALHEAKRLKEPVRAASTANVSLASPGASIDGATLSSGDRVLLKDQTTASQNGIYTWLGAATALSRTADADSATDFGYGFILFVREGTINNGSYWKFTQTAAVTLGTTSITFANVSSTTFSDAEGDPAAVSTTATDGTSTYAARRDHVHALGILTTQGDIIYAGASGVPARLGIGTSGHVLTSNGAGANPSWQPSGSGTNPTLYTTNPDTTVADNTSVTLAWTTDIWDTDSQHFTSSANLTGTVAKTNGSAALVGTGTSFTTELSVGQIISVPGGLTERKVVTVITDNTHLTVNSNFGATSSGQTVARVNDAVVARTAGKYRVVVSLAWVNAASGYAQIRIDDQGGNFRGGGHTNIVNDTVNSFFMQQAVAILQLAQWEFFTVTVRQTSGTSKTCYGAGSLTGGIGLYVDYFAP